MSAATKKFCFKCRTETDHAYVGTVGGRHLYQCPCGAAAREITPRELMTSVPLPPKPAPAAPRPVTKIKASVPPKARPYTNRSPMNKAWLSEMIEKVVDKKVAELKAGLSREEVVAVVQEQLREAVGETAAAPCPRRPHRGRCGKICAEAKAAAQ